MTTNTFRWSQIQPAERLEQSRSTRFRPEMRPLLLNYFGLSPGMDVLEVGCGPDTMASFLAEGIDPGTVTGVDLEEDFIQRATNKAQQRSISNVSFVVGNAYQLPFPDGQFDAVVSYTGIGVLADPVAGVKEMLRVCRSGGTISIAEAVTGRSGIRFSGVDSILEDESFPGSRRYHELLGRLQSAVAVAPIPGVGSRVWSPASMFGLLGGLGVTRVRLNAWGYGSAPDDARVSADERHLFREGEYQSLKARLGKLRESGGVDLTPDEIEELMMLAKARLDWLRDGAAYDWEAGVSVVASGIKPE